MTLKEFKALLKEDSALQQKFAAAVDAIKDIIKDAVTEEDLKDYGVALSKIIKSLGCDVPADEITQGFINLRKLDEKELEAISGGYTDYLNFNDKYGHQSTTRFRLIINYTLNGQPDIMIQTITNQSDLWTSNLESWGRDFITICNATSGPNETYVFTGIRVEPIYENDIEAELKKLLG